MHKVALGRHLGKGSGGSVGSGGSGGRGKGRNKGSLASLSTSSLLTTLLASNDAMTTAKISKMFTIFIFESIKHYKRTIHIVLYAGCFPNW